MYLSNYLSIINGRLAQSVECSPCNRTTYE